MTPGTFADPNTYLSPNSGVGAFIPNAAPQKDPFDSFLTTYDTVNTWRRQKEADNMAKQKYVKDNLADLDFKTEGVLPSQKAKEYLQRGKEHMTEELTSYGVAGQDPFSPASREAYATASGLKKAYEVDVNILKEANDARVALHEANTKNPDAFNPQDIVNWDRELMDAEVTEIPKVLAKMPKPRQTSLPEIFSKLAKDKVGQKTEINYDPQTHAYTEKQGYQDLDGMLMSEYNNNPIVKDQINAKLEDIMVQAETDPIKKQEFEYLEKQAAGRGISVPELMAINEGKPFFTESEGKMKFDPEYTKYLGWKYGAGKDERDAIGSDLNHWTQIMAGVDGYYDQNGEFKMNIPVGRVVGTFNVMEQDASGNPKQKALPNELLDGKIDVDAEGNTVWYVKTSKSEYEGGTTGDGWIRVNDPYQMYQIGGAKFGQKSGMYIDMAEKFGGEMGTYNPKTKSWDKEAFAPSLYPDMKPPEGKESLMRRQSVPNTTNVQIPFTSVTVQKPFTIEQKKAFNKFKFDNGREPNETEMTEIMKGKVPKKQDAKAEEKSATREDIKKLVGQKGYEGYSEEELVEYYKSQGYNIK